MVQNVTVYLDEEMPPVSGRVRCGFIVARDHRGRETLHNDLIDNSEYPGLKELIGDIAAVLKVRKSAVWVS